MIGLTLSGRSVQGEAPALVEQGGVTVGAQLISGVGDGAPLGLLIQNQELEFLKMLYFSFFDFSD